MTASRYLMPINTSISSRIIQTCFCFAFLFPFASALPADIVSYPLVRVQILAEGSRYTNGRQNVAVSGSQAPSLPLVNQRQFLQGHMVY